MAKGIVEFNEKGEDDNFIEKISRKVSDFSQTSLTDTVKKWKLARTDAQAQYVLIAVGMISLMATVFILMYSVWGIGTGRKTYRIVVPSAKKTSVTNPQAQKKIIAPSPKK